MIALVLALLACGDPSRVAGKNFRIEAAPLGACAKDAPCTVVADVIAENGFHLNRDYPFTLADANLPLSGETFEVRDDQNGRLLVRFDRPTEGPSEVSGTFKLSICREDLCQIETPQIAVVVP